MGRLETADFCDLYLFDQGNLIFIMEKSGRGQGTLKTDLCGNHESFFRGEIRKLDILMSSLIKDTVECLKYLPPGNH